ncbi:MAG: nucleotidyltransferase domain-containing protein [Bacillota bacterium]|nr:nucleotidyltransferase domain-containing protein [Bacillota bacterium]
MTANNLRMGDELDKLVTLLRRYRPVAVYLFGSYAAGTQRPDSDLDLAMLLPTDRPSLTGPERMDLIGELEEVAGRQVDLVVLNKAPLPLQFEVIRTGKVLYESDSEVRTDAEDLIVRDFLDLQPWYERSYREMIEEAEGG